MKNSEMIPAAFMTGRVEDADVILLGIPYDKTLSAMKGAADGPVAICDQLKYQVEDVDHRLFKSPLSSKKILDIFDGGSSFGLENVVKVYEYHLQEVRHLEDPVQMVETVVSKAMEFLKMNKFLVGLGGEHTVILGLVSAIRECFGDIAVIQVDAHADLRWDTSDYDPKPKEIAHSTVMRHIHNSGVEVRQLGIRSMSAGELVYAARSGLLENIFFARSRAHETCSFINSIKAKRVYLSVDVDGLDPSIMPATGTPEPGGLLWWPFMNFAEDLIRLKEVVGIDVNEVSQGDDFSVADRIRTAYNAALLIHQLLCFKFRKFCK